jgi:transposase InsO family protein
LSCLDLAFERYYGPEFVGRTLDAWAYRRGVDLRFIRPGKPIENAYAESFNDKFRDECLNEHWFLNLAEAQAVIEAWRIDYNTVRPHRSLGQQTPAAYAAAACAGSAVGRGACSAAATSTVEQPEDSDGLSLSV